MFPMETRSLEESLPGFFKTRDCSIVDIACLIANVFNKPAACQSSIKHSPLLTKLLKLMVK